MRKFLVILDDSEECVNAVRFAAMRARKTNGGVVMLGVVTPEEFQHWVGVGDLMKQEAREKFEAQFDFYREKLEEDEGITPELVLREGETAREVLAQIADDPEIGVLVLAAATHGDGPGPLVTQLVGKQGGRMPIPVTVVPGELTLERIRAIC